MRYPINVRSIVGKCHLPLSSNVHNTVSRRYNEQPLHQLRNRNFTSLATSVTTSSIRDVQIVEVGPRDGLQNESSLVSTDNKVKLIELLMNAGCTKIEIGSFVSPKAVPNMANTDEVIQLLTKKLIESTTADARFSVLIPTLKYLESALSSINSNSNSSNENTTSNAGIIDEIAIFASASESFSQKNLNCSIQESMIRFQEIMNITQERNIPVRGYLSCVIGCPYDGVISSKVVGQLTEQLLELGCYEVALSDTIGIGTPKSTSNMLNDALIATGGQTNVLAVHFHDTYGQALSNILVALELGITTIDSSVAGLGGCPYAKGATGNVATEDLVYMLHGMGMQTGIDLDKLTEAAEFICAVLGRPSNSKAGSAITAKRKQN